MPSLVLNWFQYGFGIFLLHSSVSVLFFLLLAQKKEPKKRAGRHERSAQAAGPAHIFRAIVPPSFNHFPSAMLSAYWAKMLTGAVSRYPFPTV